MAAAETTPEPPPEPMPEPTPMQTTGPSPTPTPRHGHHHLRLFSASLTITDICKTCIVVSCPLPTNTSYFLGLLICTINTSYYQLRYCTIWCFGPAIGHHQYWKASPVDTTLLVFRDHKESGLKLGLWGGHTLSQRAQVSCRPQAARGY
jgi:hypothetical protein